MSISVCSFEITLKQENLRAFALNFLVVTSLVILTKGLYDTQYIIFKIVSSHILFHTIVRYAELRLH